MVITRSLARGEPMILRDGRGSAAVSFQVSAAILEPARRSSLRRERSPGRPLCFGRVWSVLNRAWRWFRNFLWLLLTAVNRGWHWFRNLLRHLLPSVVITVLLGAAVASALTLFLTWLVLKVPPTGTLPAPGPDGTSPFLDVLKVGLTVSAGIGGAVALVVAYRRQRHLEVDDAGRRSRYTSAAEQLGDPQAAVRLAGVYAMAHLADEWAEQRQPCVDVLCAYLRLPWAGDSTQLEPNTTTTEHTWPDGMGQRKVTKTYSGRAGEREVRQTLVRVIASHLQPHTGSSTWSGSSWSDLDIDLTNAALPHADFRGANFRGRTSFRRTSFSGFSSFDGAQFSADAWFDEAQFSADGRFVGARFSADATFVGAQFSADAWFDEVQFSSAAWFLGARFSADATFVGAQFSGAARFDGAQFSGEASFYVAQFSATANFRQVQFSADANFRQAQFSADANFRQVQFSADGDFADAQFDTTVFGGAEFSGVAWFDGAQFTAGTSFVATQFSSGVSFNRAQFSITSFERALFCGETSFAMAQFALDAYVARASLPSRSAFASALIRPSEEALKQAVFRDEQPEHAATSTS
jgi:uncharacterized protein YjbI with pentapeptide repeats